MRPFIALTVAAVAAVAPATGAAQAAARSASARVDVVVTLDAPALAGAWTSSRVLTVRARRSRLDLASPTSRGYLRALASRQAGVARRLRRAIPSARVYRHYAVVLDGLAVSLPESRLPDLARLPGVARVWPSVSYRAQLDRGPEIIGADQLWNSSALPVKGEGMKIGIIDDGVDSSHPFFDATGYTYPPGFPKGNTAYTTPKVIVARAFAPPTTTWKYARLPFDPVQSEHGTHVAGIAAGVALPGKVDGLSGVSGVAPRAYIGNYKALSTPSSFGLIENVTEIVAAIEAAVKDGMDVINMSFGEVEIEPSRNVLVAAVSGAAEAGVVPVIAAGNSFEYGFGSVSVPGSAERAITVAATTKSGDIADFSSAGPSAFSLDLKPDVSAPGVAILSSVPKHVGSWAQFSGTSMAAPHVAGGAALLRERHPTWTVEQIKSALVTTGRPVREEDGTGEVPTTREGGGLVSLPGADRPLVFASPPSLSFGLLRPGARAARVVDVSDAGDGAGPWSVDVELQAPPRGVKIGAPALLTVPGRLALTAAASASAAGGDVTGFVVLRRGTDERRLPFWLRVARPELPPPTRVLVAAGTYHGNTLRGKARVSSYRYPDVPAGMGFPVDLRGPEQVFRLRLREGVTNFGVRAVSTARGVSVSPRIVSAGDENRLDGFPALPMDVNPYRGSLYGDAIPAAGVIGPAPGTYDVVFDTVSRRRAGKFTFRLWIDDRTPPRAKLAGKTVSAGHLLLEVTDAGSGVDPRSLSASVDGRPVAASLDSRTGRATVVVPRGLARGRHRLVFRASDWQETKNSENVAGILPNTTTLRTAFVVG